MISEPPEYDPIAIWQNQQKHVPPSFQDILMRARRFEARNRREFLQRVDDVIVLHPAHHRNDYARSHCQRDQHERRGVRLYPQDLIDPAVDAPREGDRVDARDHDRAAAYPADDA